MIAEGTAAAIDGAQRDFDELVESTRRFAYKVAYHFTGNRDEAEDLIQDAYLRAYRSFGTFNSDLSFRGWLYRILSNLFKDRQRRSHRRKTVSLDQPLPTGDGNDDFILELADEESDPQERLLKHILDERLERALAKVSKQFRIAVLLHAVEGMSYEEIARATGTSIGTVRSRIHRGRKALQRYMTNL